MFSNPNASIRFVRRPVFADRRQIIISSAAVLASTAMIGLPRQANAFFALLLRGLTLGGARAGASALAGRTALAGRGMLRPTRPAYQNNVPYGRFIFQAGRWIHRLGDASEEASYHDASEYDYEYARYPQVFGAVPADFLVENATDCDQYMPESELILSFNDGSVWQAYEIPAFDVPPGTWEYTWSLDGVPTGWSYAGFFSNFLGEIESDLVDS